MAANVGVSHNFVQGTPSVADDVDDNFTDIVTWINANATHLDGSKAFTGVVTLAGVDPSLPNHAVRKAYVDALNLLSPADYVFMFQNFR
jgi:hypothetical protein